MSAPTSNAAMAVAAHQETAPDATPETLPAPHPDHHTPDADPEGNHDVAPGATPKDSHHVAPEANSEEGHVAPGTALTTDDAVLVQATMPTIDEDKTLAADALRVQPSVATLASPPGTAVPTVLSTQASAATLVADHGGVAAANPSAATLVPAGGAVAAYVAPAAAETKEAAPAAVAVALPPGAPPAKAKTNPFALKDETKTKFKDFWRIFSYSTLWDRVMLGVAVLASILTGITMPLMNVVFGRVFGSFSGVDKQETTPEKSGEIFMQEIITCVYYLIYLFIARLVLNYIAFLFFRIASLRISAAMRLEYMRCLFSQSVSKIDLFPPGQAAAIITTTANTVQAGISERLASFLQSLSLIVSAMIISFLYSWNLTLVTGSGMVLIIIVYSATTPFLVRIMNRVQDSEITAATISTEIFSSIRMVAACGAEDKMQKRYMGWVEESRKRGLKMSPIISFQQGPIFFAIYATFALAFWYSLNEYMKGNITSPTSLIVVVFSVMMMTTSIQGITTPLQAAARAASSATIFYMVIDQELPQTGGVKAPEVSAAEDLVLTHVSFAYPSRPTEKILDGLSLRFPAGKMTAIVGPSGSGKSTIVQLLERWYELDGDMITNPLVLWLRSGFITCGTTHLKDMDLKWWRSQIGLVQQEPFLFNDTIYRNVEHGLIGTAWEDASPAEKSHLVKEACKEAFADEFITRLPEGYDTPVGDAGIKLSGGQRQRIAIARAIVKQPKILILDEATSAIDVRGEQMVQAALDKVSANRTTITIAHRLSTVRKADNIVVMRRGQVIEQGTHANLMALEGGAYRVLVGTQLLRSEEEADARIVAGADGAGGSGGELGEKETRGKDSIDIVYTEDSAFGDAATLAVPEEGVRKARGLLGSFGMLLREQRRLWPWYILLCFGALGGGAAAPIQAYLFAALVSLFSLFGNYDFLGPLTSFWCLMFTVLAIGVGLSYFALAWASTSTSFNITHYYRDEYISNILNKPISFYDHEDHNVGALTARLATDPLQLQQLLGMNMAFVIISGLNVIGCLTISFIFGWKLTAVTALTSIPIIVGAAFFRVRYERQFEEMANLVFAESAKFATESIGAFRTVSSLTLEDAICRRYAKLLHDHIRDAFFKNSISTFIFALSDSIALLCMAFVLWYGGKLMADMEYWPFQFVIVYIAVMQGGMGAGQWLSFAPNIAQASVAANRIIDLRRTDQHDGRLVSLDKGDLGNEDGGVAVEFRNVWFRYPTRDVPILNGLSFTIGKGQFAAFVGASGSGKTTVISLLERFYRANAGRILINGLDVADLALGPYRKDISLVAQEPSLFDGTLRDNLVLGIDDAALDPAALDARLHQACRDAGIHDFIASLPDGYLTECGMRGVALSGGQKQRLSIARALIRNPRLLLLDEATSNLDSETERQVQEVFERTKEARTMVVVAHRLATVQNADVIFVLGDGKVMEKGDHASLLKKKGMYYQMCQAQALDK